MPGNTIEKIRSSFEDLIGNKRALIKILSIAVILSLALIIKIVNKDNSEINVENINSDAESADSYDSSELYVDIGGGVARPGVYKVDPGTRLYEVIELAGGLSPDADTYSVNQAAFVEDGEKIIIPIISDDSETDSHGGIPSLININTASKEQLSSLSGIGDVIAERIIEYRTSNRFKKKEDLMSVKGIGSSIYHEIENDITV